LIEVLGEPLPEPTAWLGATFVDSALRSAPVVIDVAARSPAEQAGLTPGDLVVGIDGVPVARAVEVYTKIAATAPFAVLSFEVDRVSGRVALAATLGTSARVPDPEERRPDPVVWAAAGARIASVDSTTPEWALQLLRARVLLAAGDPEAAAELLRGLLVGGDPPFGQGAIDYWLGVALASGETPDLAGARAAFERAAGRQGARLEHNDGPRVAPRALARLAWIEARNGGQ
jgi:membrane-associated protease RseP (regulator of RpoE activity)